MQFSIEFASYSVEVNGATKKVSLPAKFGQNESLHVLTNEGLELTFFNLIGKRSITVRAGDTPIDSSIGFDVHEDNPALPGRTPRKFVRAKLNQAESEHTVTFNGHEKLTLRSTRRNG